MLTPEQITLITALCTTPAPHTDAGQCWECDMPRTLSEDNICHSCDTNFRGRKALEIMPAIKDELVRLLAENVGLLQYTSGLERKTAALLADTITEYNTSWLQSRVRQGEDGVVAHTEADAFSHVLSVARSHGLIITEKQADGTLKAVSTSSPELPTAPASDVALCGLCQQPMPPGEEMFQYHGHSGPCPEKPR